MKSHPKSATAVNNLHNASYYIVQKRKIAQRHAHQSKTLEAHVVLHVLQNHIGESVRPCTLCRIKTFLRSTMGQGQLSSIAVINIERKYANKTMQDDMQRIIDIFGHRSNLSSYFF